MAEEPESDETLMLRFAAGDALAFNSLYRRHELKVWRFIQRSVRNQATADELMQDVWLTVARQASRYQPTARLTTWIFTIARNRLIDQARRGLKNLSVHVSLAAAANDSEVNLVEEIPADERMGPAAQTQSVEETANLLEAVEQLPREQREAFLLQAEGELSIEEIAAITGASFETVKSRLRYARTKLRELLREYA